MSGLSVKLQNIIVITPSLPARNVKDYIALAKSKPGSMLFGSSGNGSPGHLAAVLLESMSGAQLTHVPYKGGSDASTAVLAGELHMTFASPTAALALRPRLRVLAVTSLARDPSLPDVPTMDESGLKGYDATFWLGLTAPARTPQAIIKRLNALLRDAVSDPEVVKTLQRQGLNAAPSSPQELTARIRADYAKWKRVLEAS